MKTKCPKCGSEKFFIVENNSCENCKYNGAWNEDAGEYTTDEKVIAEKKLIRNQISDNWSCEILSHAREGCWIVECVECGDKSNSIEKSFD